MDRLSHPHAGLEDEQDDLQDSPGLSESVDCCMGHRRFMSKIGLGKQNLKGFPISYCSLGWVFHIPGYYIVLTCPGNSDTSCGDLAEALLRDAEQGVT